jgi:hypothetical protein
MYFWEKKCYLFPAQNKSIRICNKNIKKSLFARNGNNIHTKITFLSIDLKSYVPTVIFMPRKTSFTLISIYPDYHLQHHELRWFFQVIWLITYVYYMNDQIKKKFISLIVLTSFFLMLSISINIEKKQKKSINSLLCVVYIVVSML